MNSVIHLTEEQIDDHFIGDLSVELTAHLEACAHCQARVAEMKGAIDSFREVTLAWGERQSATMALRPAGIATKSAHGSRAFWAATATAALLVGVAVPLSHRGSSRVEPQILHSPASPSQTFAEQREAQIAEDNLMMQAIDRELGAPVNSPSETFGLDTSVRAPRSVHSGSVQD